MVAVVWRLIYAYYPLINFHYIAPPGDDGAVHMQYITNLINNGLKITINGYPMGFHLLVVFLSRIFLQTPLNILVWFTPMLLVIPIPAIYFVGKKMFGHPAAGAFASIFWGVVALGPIRAYGDGNYPNLLASSFLLPFAVLYVYQLITKPKWKYLLLMLFFAALIICTHHLTLVYLAIAVVPWLLMIFSSYLMKAKLKKKIILILALIISAIILALLSWFVMGTLVRPFVDTILSGGSLASYFGAMSEPISLSQVMELNNPLLIIAGLISLLILMVSNNHRSQKLLIAFWVLILFAASSTSYFGLPGRFVRELAIPLSLIFGYATALVWDWSDKYKRGWMFVAIVLVGLSTEWVASWSRPYALPEPYKAIQRVQDEQETAYAWINAHNDGKKTIISNNHNFYVPYLINNPVTIILSPAEVPTDLSSMGVQYILIGARPSQSDEAMYPYFANFNEIGARLQKIPNIKLVQKYKFGTSIYEYMGK